MSETAATIAEPRRRERTILRIRQEIISAAAVTFARKGFKGTTMAEIARAAGYTPPTLYSYFGSKSDIFAGLVDFVLEEIASTYRDELEGVGFEERLKLLLYRQLEMAHRNRHAFAVFFAVRPLEEPVSVGGEATGFDFCVGQLAAWISRSATPEELNGWSPDDLALCLAGMIQAAVRRSIRDSGQELLNRDGLMIAELFFNGVRAGTPVYASRSSRKGDGSTRNKTERANLHR